MSDTSVKDQLDQVQRGVRAGCRHTIGKDTPECQLRYELVVLQVKILSGHAEEGDRERVREIKEQLSR